LKQSPLFVLLLTLLALNGCNDTPFTPDGYGTPPLEILDGNPVTMDSTVYVASVEGITFVPIQSHTRDAFFWGERLTATSSADWIEIVEHPEQVEPYGTTQMGVKVYREGLESGSYGEYITLWYDERYMQTVDVVVQVGAPDAVPIGVYNNYIRFPAGEDRYPLDLIFNSDDIPEGRSGWEFVNLDVSEHWLNITGVVFPVVPPIYVLFYEVDRYGLSPGYYEGHLDVFWRNDLAQVIYVEVEVE
jgi:hypothetical protein